MALDAEKTYSSPLTRAVTAAPRCPSLFPSSLGMDSAGTSCGSGPGSWFNKSPKGRKILIHFSLPPARFSVSGTQARV
eukprot:1149410-Rhodomonas_salina.2